MRGIAIALLKKTPFFRKKARAIKRRQKDNRLKEYQDKMNIEDKAIIFEAYMGRKYTCSPKAIYEEMIADERFNNFTFVWVFKNPEEKENIELLSRAIKVKFESEEYYKWFATAKYIVTNSIVGGIGSKRREQVYIQTWHGTPLKRLGYDLTIEKGNATNSLEEIKTRYEREAKKIDYLISPSRFTSEKLRTTFNLDKNNQNTQILETGYPRNDFLHNYNEEDVDRIKRELGLENTEKKIILYAPTFRDNNHKASSGFNYDLGLELKRLKYELEDEFVLLFRIHYLVANAINIDEYEGFIVNVTDYEEINDLYIVSDALITDYSSVFFDYANLKKPMIFYMYDLKEYKDDIRGFYIDLTELPGEIIEKEENLIKEIKEIENFKFDEKYKAFYEKYNYLDDGSASKRVVEIIKESDRHKLYY